MTTGHLWFASGHYSLLGHLDAHPENSGRLGILMVPPFGWEDVCSYRPRRFMARAFAAEGIPTLRYDLPGTGDSSGGARDPRLFDSWIQSVSDAAAELRDRTGVEEVAVLGVHLGATLAMTAVSRGANFHQLILWGPVAKGRTLLRELRAFANIESWEHLPEQEAPPQLAPGFESGGFLLSPETLRTLEDLDISAGAWRSGRVLLLSRDELPHDARLTAALPATATVTMATGHGYSAMMSTPQESLFPKDTTRLILEFLASEDGVGGQGRGNLSFARPGQAEPSAPQVLAAQIPVAGDTGALRRHGVVESIYRIEASSREMFGILAEPAEPAEPAGPATPLSHDDPCLLFLNPGGVRHTGPNRMWVETARRWAARGIRSLRLDLQGLGESDGEEFVDVPGLYREHMVDQIEVAIESLRQRAGVKRFIVIGLCSGACWGFHAALRNSDVHGAILVNPSLLWWDAGADRRRMLRGVTTGYAQWADWTRMVYNRIGQEDIRRAAGRVAERLGRTRADAGGHLTLGFDTVSQAWSDLETRRTRVTLVFREGEALLSEMEVAGQFPGAANAFVRCIRLPNGGHTFRPLWAQKILRDLIDSELDGMLRAVPGSTTAMQPDEQAIPPTIVHA